MIDLAPAYLATVQRILAAGVPGCEVWAFGSRVSWTAKEYSDLDLALIGPQKLDRATLRRLTEAFEESNLPFRVDVVDWHATSRSFQQVIEAQYEVLQQGARPQAEGQVAPARGKSGVADEWQVVTVGDLAARTRNALVGGPFGSNLVSRDYVDTGVPVIRGQNMGMGRWVSGDFVFVSHEKADELSANAAVPGDLIFTQRGTIGQVAIVPPSPFGRYVISQSQMKLTPDPAKADGAFLYYVFSSPLQQEHVRLNAIQTGVPHTNLGILRDTSVSLPPLAEQRAIARILGTLDDKIELNRRMNATLEAMAQALFKSWFVDFDPVLDNALAAGNPIPDAFADHAARRAAVRGQHPPLPADLRALFPDRFHDSALGPIPAGWQVRSLDEIADFLNGAACQHFPAAEGEESLPVIKIRELRQGVTDQTDRANTNVPARYRVADGDLLFSWSGSLLATVWCGGPGFLNQHLFKVTSKYFPQWFVLGWLGRHLSEFQCIAVDKATTMGHIKRHHLTDAATLVPPNSLLDKMTAHMAPLLSRHLVNELETRRIAVTRDTLLPKLISGKLNTRAISDSGEMSVCK